MTKAKDYENYDCVEIIVKKENVDEVVSSYGEFLWKELSRKEDRKYNDVLHVSFYRAHNIQNKDRLQLLQVYYEFALNDRAELNEKKHHKSKAGICNLVFFTAILLVGIWSLIFYFKTPVVFWSGAFLSLLTVFFAVFFGKKLRKLYKKETERFKLKDQELKSKTSEIIDQVKRLTKISEGGK